MSKKIFAIALSIMLLVSMCLVSACDDTVETEVLNARQQAFVDAVEAIETPITLDSGVAIDAAYSAYAFLDEYDRDSKTVADSKALLDGYQTEYTALKSSSSGNQGGDNTDNSVQEELIARFLAAVEALPALDDLTLDDRKAINNAYTSYDRLSEESKQNKDVISAYSKLQQLDNRVSELEEMANQETWQRMADEFISAVADIGDVTLETGALLEDLLFQYSKFPDGVKNIGGVAEAKEILDAKYARYQGLKDQDDIQKFVSAVRSIGQVTMESEGKIIRAESIYKYLSDSAKSKETVIENYETLVAARATFDALFNEVESQRMARFLEAVSKIRTDLDNVDITWFDALNEAQEAYSALSYKTTLLPEIEEAFEIWSAAQAIFDKLGFKQIPMVDPNLLYSGDIIPHIVVQNEKKMLDPLRQFYGASSMNELAKQAIAYLNVYVDGVYVDKGELDLANLGHIIYNTEVLSILKKLAVEHSEIVSGANLSFSIHFEDREQRYIHSNMTKVSETMSTYIW